MTIPSFDALYQLWYEIDGRRDPVIYDELIRTFREAWEAGGDADRDAVLRFIMLRRVERGFDLVVEALASPERQLARAAAAVALSLLIDGFDLGPTVRQAFERFAERFPDSDSFTWAALQVLHERDDAPGQASQ
jgi:hypothetical protein